MHGSRGFIDHYRQTNKAVDTDDPQRIIALLLAGAVERANLARAALERGDIAAKVQAIQSALGIVDGLRLSLDLEAGGEIAAGLESLYDYIGRRLIEANAGNDAAKLVEVTGLLQEIETAWAAIPRQLGASYATERAGA